MENRRSDSWPGTENEQAALIRAAHNNCGCKRINNRMIEIAGCHELLEPNNRVFKRLIFGRRQRKIFITEEFQNQSDTIPAPKYTETMFYLIHLLGDK